jgi:hypothetical protein
LDAGTSAVNGERRRVVRESDQSLKAEMRAAISGHRERIRGRRPRWLVGTEADEPQEAAVPEAPPVRDEPGQAEWLDPPEFPSEPAEPEPVETERSRRRWWQFGRRR